MNLYKVEGIINTLVLIYRKADNKFGKSVGHYGLLEEFN